MKNIQKKLRNKKGFTLVECIVAMAVLVISSYLLMMIMSVTVARRNANMALEQEIDKQVDLLNGGGDGSEVAITESLSKGITFDNGSNGSVIPEDGSMGVIAEQKHYDSDSVLISDFNFNFSAYNTPNKGSGSPGKPSKPTDEASSSVKYGSPMVSGAAKIDGDINVKEGDIGGGKKKWEVSFKCNSNQQEQSFKIQLPPGAKILRKESSAMGCSHKDENGTTVNDNRVDCLGDNIVRVCPNNGDVTLIIVFEQDGNTDLRKHFGLKDGGETNSVHFPFTAKG